MAIQVFGSPPPKPPSFAQKVNRGVGAGLAYTSQFVKDLEEKENSEKESQMLFEQFGTKPPRDPELRKIWLAEQLRGQGKEKLLNQKREMLSGILGNGNSSQFGQQMQQGQQGQSENQRNVVQQLQGITPEEVQEQSMQGQQQEPFNPANISDADIAQLSALDPNLGREVRAAKDTALRQQRHQEDVNERRNIEQEKTKRKNFESDRAYHTQFSKPEVERVAKIEQFLPKQRMAQDLARDSIESGEVSSFSLNHLAEIFNAPSLMTQKGTQLILAAKEQLFPTLARISAKAQNQYMEKRFSTMVPHIGLSTESNLGMQEILEAETDMDEAYIKEFNRLSEEDFEKYGFEKKDIGRRANQAAKINEKEIMSRTAFRLRELEESEKGLNWMKKNVGNKVVPGTPMTFHMAILYRDKFGPENWEAVANKNGYTIPTSEEFKMYQQRPEKFRERFEE